MKEYIQKESLIESIKFLLPSIDDEEIKKLYYLILQVIENQPTKEIKEKND